MEALRKVGLAKVTSKEIPEIPLQMGAEAPAAVAVARVVNPKEVGEQDEVLEDRIILLAMKLFPISGTSVSRMLLGDLITKILEQSGTCSSQFSWHLSRPAKLLTQSSCYQIVEVPWLLR